MNKTMKEVLHEIKLLLLLFFVFVIILKIAFYNESLLLVFRLVFSVFWLFVLPGFFVMLYWQDKLEFIVRFFTGVGMSTALLGISAYYLNLFKVHFNLYAFIVPTLIIMISFILLFLKYSRNYKNR